MKLTREELVEVIADLLSEFGREDVEDIKKAIERFKGS